MIFLTEWWQIAFERRLAEKKKIIKFLRITIYGSFWPNNQKCKLLEIVDFLQEKGFEDTDIVGGILRPNPGELNIFDLSMFWLKESDLNFLIFTREGKRIGVTTELDQILISPDMYEIWSNCVIFHQIEDDRDSIGDLQKSKIRDLNKNRERVCIVPFETWENLKSDLYLHAFDCYKAMSNILYIRSTY